MTIYLGKRSAGGLTKASPGDTLYIPFATYNDSGAPITDTGFSHTKIEIYKNNEGTARATDSGVWLGDSGLNYEIGGTRVAASAFEDTGQYGNVTGLYSIGIRLFNTSDDTGFYDAGSTYHVSIQGLKVKAGQGWVSMNFFPAMFEIAGKRVQAGAYTFQGAVGFPQADIRAVLGDTGAANLDQGRFGVLSDSGRAAAVLDTGKVASAIWTSHATRTLTAFQFDTGVWGSNFASGRTLTSFLFDTGIRDTVWRASPSSYTSDTGSFGYAAGRVMAVRNDTGAAHLDQGRFGVLSDSGVAAAVLDTGKVASAVWTSHATRALTAFAFDTGVAQTVWRESGSTYTDTGSLGYMVDNPPGATVDTGLIVNGVWNALRADHVVANTFGQYVIADMDLVDGDTGAADYWQKVLTFVNTLPVDVWQIRADTGPANRMGQFFGTKLSDNAQIDTGTFAITGGDLLDTGTIDAISDRITADVGTDTGIAHFFAQSLLDLGVVDGRKVVEAMRLWTAVLGGTVSGAGTGTEIFKSTATVPANRVTATVDSSGNRSAITYALDT